MRDGGLFPLGGSEESSIDFELLAKFNLLLKKII
jgi:hypothetical protein